MNLSSPGDISTLLRKFGITPRRKYGQNFLVDRNTLAKIVSSAAIGPGEKVIEIGTGLGVLTLSLANAVGIEGSVVTIELDRTLASVLIESLGPYPQVKVVFQSALDVDWPSFLIDCFGDSPSVGIKVVANIPYNITSPLIVSLLSSKRQFQVIVLLVQKEVALRLAAKPSTPEYGALSLFAQLYAKIEIVGSVTRKVFLPVPDVDSAIIRLTPHAESPVKVKSNDRLTAVIRASFGQRRKTLINSLSGDPALKWDRERAASALRLSGIDANRRGETLSLMEFAALVNADDSLTCA